MTLNYTYGSRGSLKLFTSFITVKTFTKLNLGDNDKLEIRISQINRCGSRSPDIDIDIVISRCCFAEHGKEMYQELYRTYTTIVLLVSNLLFSDVAIAVMVFLNSLLPTPYSLLPTPYSLLPTPYSLLPSRGKTGHFFQINFLKISFSVPARCAGRRGSGTNFCGIPEGRICDKR